MIPDVGSLRTRTMCPAARWSKGRTGNGDDSSGARCSCSHPTLGHACRLRRILPLRFAPQSDRSVPSAARTCRPLVACTRTANVAYGGDTVGKVTCVEPTEAGVKVTTSIGDQLPDTVDATANVPFGVGRRRTVPGSDVRECTRQQLLHAGNKPSPPATYPRRSAPHWTPSTGASPPCPRTRSRRCSMNLRRRWADSAQRCTGWSMPRGRSAANSEANAADIDDLVRNTGPLINSQADSGEAIRAVVARSQCPHLADRGKGLARAKRVGNATPTMDDRGQELSGVRDSLPQTLAKIEVVPGCSCATAPGSSGSWPPIRRAVP